MDVTAGGEGSGISLGEDSNPETSNGEGQWSADGHCQTTALTGDRPSGQGSEARSESHEAPQETDSCCGRTVCSPEGVQTHPQTSASSIIGTTSSETQGRTHPQAQEEGTRPQAQAEGAHSQAQEEGTRPQVQAEGAHSRVQEEGTHLRTTPHDSSSDRATHPQGRDHVSSRTSDIADSGEEDEDVLFDMKAAQSATHKAITGDSNHMLPAVSENQDLAEDCMMPSTKDADEAESQGLLKRTESPVGAGDHVMPSTKAKDDDKAESQSLPRRTDSPVVGGSDETGCTANQTTTVEGDSKEKSTLTISSVSGVDDIGSAGAGGASDSTLNGVTSGDAGGGVTGVIGGGSDVKDDSGDSTAGGQSNNMSR